MQAPVPFPVAEDFCGRLLQVGDVSERLSSREFFGSFKAGGRQSSASHDLVSLIMLGAKDLTVAPQAMPRCDALAQVQVGFFRF